jgi:hypothetical protein
MLVVTVAVLLAPRLLRGRRARAVPVVLATAAGLVLAWSATGAVSAGRASNAFGGDFIRNLPRDLRWVDHATGGRPTLFLGQGIDDENGVWLLEFWNRSLHKVWSLDGTAPGPGPRLTPDLIGARGLLWPSADVDYVVVTPGIDPVGTLVREERNLRLFRIEQPLRLAHAQTGILGDGWTVCEKPGCKVAKGAYSQYSTPGNRPGYAIVFVSRAGWTGPDAPATVQVRVGRLEIGDDRQPHLGRVTARRTWTIHSGIQRTFFIPTPKPPYRIEVGVGPTFCPCSFGSSDRRRLGAQVSFGFTEQKQKDEIRAVAGFEQYLTPGGDDDGEPAG